MTKRKLICIDPGLMTGMGLIDITDLDNPKLEWSDELDIDGFYRKFPETLIAHWDSVEVVIEKFIITTETAKKSPQPWSMELIGVVKYFCWLYGVKMTLQQPSERDFMTNPRLKLLGFWHKGGAGHANDSLRHAGVYLLNQHRKLAKKLIT